MAVESRRDLTNYPFWLSGRIIHRDSEVIAQDGARSVPLKQYAVMAQNATTRKWVPLTNLAATDGTAKAKGIYVGPDITAAALVAGDVTSCAIVVGGDLATCDGGQLILENSLTLNSVVAGTTLDAHLVQDDLAKIGIYTESVMDFENFENGTN